MVDEIYPTEWYLAPIERIIQLLFSFGHEVDGMSLMWFMRRLVSPKETGLFAYLTSRNQNKTRVELEHARQIAARDLIDHLPHGAVFRESTADGWREIWMPSPLHAPPLFITAADSSETVQDTKTLNESMARNLRALSQDNEAGTTCDSSQPWSESRPLD